MSTICWRPELIIFDCDGVLIDSEIISATTLLELLEANGLSIELSHVQEHFLGRSFPTVAASIRSQFKIDLPGDFESEYRRRLLHDFEHALRTTKGVVEVLEQLGTPYCVATSSSPERIVRSLQIVDLDHFFAGHIYTASEVRNGKPAPDLFLHVASSEGADPRRCIVIEDSLPGIEAAISAGMRVLRYTGGSHMFDPTSGNAKWEIDVPVFDSWQNFFEIVPLART